MNEQALKMKCLMCLLKRYYKTFEWLWYFHQAALWAYDLFSILKFMLTERVKVWILSWAQLFLTCEVQKSTVITVQPERDGWSCVPTTNCSFHVRVAFFAATEKRLPFSSTRSKEKLIYWTKYLKPLQEHWYLQHHLNLGLRAKRNTRHQEGTISSQGQFSSYISHTKNAGVRAPHVPNTHLQKADNCINKTKMLSEKRKREWEENLFYPLKWGTQIKCFIKY